MRPRAGGPPRRARTTFVLVGVLAVHGLATWLLLRSPPQPNRAASPRLLVRFVARSPTPPVPPVALRESEPSPAPLRRRATATRPPQAPQPISAPLPAGPTITPPVAARVTEPGASAPPADVPLDLRLRPGIAGPVTPRPPALDDPRANTARLGAGARMAATLGTDQRSVEENFGDGRSRIRRGSDCVIAETSRATALDPFGQQAQRGTAPKLLGACP